MKLWVKLLCMAPLALEAAAHAELRQVLPKWQGSAPSALQADASGPFWARRLDSGTIALERLSSGRAVELRRVSAPEENPTRFFAPLLVRGEGAPALFYRDSELLRAEEDAALSSALGRAGWEYFSAARDSGTLFAAAFGVSQNGFSRVALLGASDRPVVAELRAGSAGVWTPRALLSGSEAIVVYRGPGRAAGGSAVLIETMDLEQLAAIGKWLPSRIEEHIWPESDRFYGNPVACLDEEGRIHWAAALWVTGVDVPSGRVVVDGVELDHRGLLDLVDWLPDLVWVQGRGLVLSMAGEEGEAEIGEVLGEEFRLIATLPSVDPAFGVPPPTHLASYGLNLYVATSDGLWMEEVARVVAANGDCCFAVMASLSWLTMLSRSRVRAS